jgi:D-sedoheptulose 7-phosphate isomerase
MNIENFLNRYIIVLHELIAKLDKSAVKQIIEKLNEIEKTKGIIYILGNGGSAATASHMVNDLGVGLKRRGIKNFKVVSLADNTPVCTAIANDIGYENIFYMQLKDVLSKEDLVLAISCSGNSPNIVKAVEYAKSIGSCVIGVTGFDGGELKKLSDISFHVETPKNSYGLVEDIHMILDHIIYTYYIESQNVRR